jgi:glycosyltransferase involved in cell wall biosynthesis/predicted SAM-dependent methyltransferase
MAAHQRRVGPRGTSVDGRPHILIISHDVVDAKMAGPGIRYWELARTLARDQAVTLAVPERTSLEPDGFVLVTFSAQDRESVLQAARRADVVMPCGHTLQVFHELTELGRPIVIDGYDPFTLETLALFADAPAEKRHAHQDAVATLLAQQCLVGDFFICASERQRDRWLGLLEASGRINIRTYADDPTLRRLLDVVPFGLPSERPKHTRRVLKGVAPGIETDDRVILWGGGIWEWLDPLTLIQAIPRVLSRCSKARLIFPGSRHPDAQVPDTPMRARAERLAKDLELLDRAVFFGDWVDYADWPNYLLEADVGVALHFDTLETRLAFRTRVLDYIWAGLPMLLTQGDATSDLVQAHGLGHVVDFEDVAGVAEALVDLLEGDGERWQPRFAEARRQLTWQRAVAPLRAFCQRPVLAADRRQDGGTPPPGGARVAVLEFQSARQAQELERLRRLVAGYERGGLFGMMRRVTRWRRRIRTLRYVGWVLDRLWTEYYTLRLTREVGRATDHAFVDRAYRRVLGRVPDSFGFRHFADRLRAGQCSRRDVVADLVRSEEYRTQSRPAYDMNEVLHLLRCKMVAGLPPAEDILDLGGAAPLSVEGAFLLMGYPHPFRSLTIVDLPPEKRLGGHGTHPLERSGAWFEVGAGRVRHTQTSMTDLGALESASMDLVFSGQSIEHVSEAEGRQVMREAMRVLRPGGHFFLDTINATLARIQSPAHAIHPEHQMEYDVPGLVARLKEVGFAIKEVQGLAPMPESLARGVFDEDEIIAKAKLSPNAEICYLFSVHCTKPR